VDPPRDINEIIAILEEIACDELERRRRQP
jgi:hypothetical protein